MTIVIEKNFLSTDENKAFDSVNELILSSGISGKMYLKSYYDGWQDTLDGPKGGHFAHTTGATNTAPTIGSPVPVSTIGTGAQAGYYWDRDGKEWAVDKDQILNVQMFGADPTNTLDSTIAFNDAITYGRSRYIEVPEGVYLTSGQILIPFGASSTQLIGRGKVNTIINQVGATNTSVIRLSASYCEIAHMQLRSDSTTNELISVAPEDETQTTVLVGQDYNTIHHLRLSGTANYAVKFKTGPRVGGSTSSCYHNRITDCEIINGTTLVGIVLTDGSNANSSGANRNWITRCYFSGNINLGIWNRGAATTFINECSFEGVDYNALGPKATATAIWVDSVAFHGDSNDSCSIIDCRFEGNTNDIYNDNATLEVCAGNHDRTKCVFAAEGGTDPMFVLGGGGYSIATQKLPGYKYQTNSQEAIPNSAPVFDVGLYPQATESLLRYYRENVVFSPTLWDNSNSSAEGQTESINVCRYTLIGRVCFFEIHIKMSSLGTLTTTEGAKIGPMPFNARNISGYQAAGVCGYAQALNLAAATDGPITWVIVENSNALSLRKWNNVAGVNIVPISEISLDGELTISGCYTIESV